MSEWVIVNGHVLDCQDLQDNMRAEDDDEYDDYSGDLAYEGSW